MRAGVGLLLMTGGRSPPSAVPADDVYDARLRALVDTRTQSLVPRHDCYDLVAIGGGTAGLVGTAGMALLGARVALVERGLLGGDCLVSGCVPSKALLHAGRIAHEARHAARIGVSVGSMQVDPEGVMTALRARRAEIAEDDSVQTVRSRGIEVVHGDARFTSARSLEVAGRTLRFQRALLATGARPRMPDIPGLDTVDPLTSETFFELRRLPACVAIIGGGPVGCELAQALARLGCNVTLLQRADRLLPRDDPDASQILHDVLGEEGVDVRLGVHVRAVRRTDAGCELDLTDQTVTAQRIIVATGRAPNLHALDLPRAGIGFDDEGVTVDRRFRTTNRRVYAAGDVVSEHRFTHAAWAEAEYAVLNAFFPIRLDVASRIMPHATYTDPEVAHVGLSPEQLAARRDAVQTLTIPVHDNDRARIEGESRGFARVHLRAGSDRILAATLVCRGAGDLIAQLGLAITRKLGLQKLVSTIVPYPTRAELIRDLAYQYATSRIGPGTRRLAGWWMHWIRWWGR